MRLLELFSGTGSVGEVFRAAGWETVSVDNAPTGPCDVIADILTLDPVAIDAQYGPFDVVWASPPCTEYSAARTTAKLPRDFAKADRLVAKALEFIRVLRPRFWFIENPFTGLLKGRPIMAEMPFVTVDYCRYGMRYKRRTAIWTNSTRLEGLLCRPGSRCDAWDGACHPSRAQRAGKGPGDRHGLRELYRLPRALVEDVVAAC
jgi:hypothetical protein